ncbi:MAG: hypothetical protein P4M12_02975 [Gammaproteobacteria bacterium]|nr:hypothetical protein [Gammaproteobacteria bacterium]
MQNKSEKTKQRIEEIKSSIKAHKKNIKLLHFYAIHHLRVPSAEDKPRFVNFNAIGRYDAFRNDTLKNLTDQIFELEIELKALTEYGL